MGDPQDQSDTKPTSSLQSSSSPMPSSNEELRNLRRLILGGDLDEVFKTSIDTDELSELLPLALEKSQKNKEALARALLPTVEAAIQTSIRQDNRILSDAFFPIIGPATRKSIAAAIGNLVQSLNQTLEHSLSPQSFKWRLEARRTGKSFAEVVLVRTLIYQVEQVFFIHRESGLVMQHLVSETAIAQDPELVSAMLTALQDFVKESFVTNADANLDTLTLGEFNLWLEAGPQATLACVIRGTAPQDLRLTMRQTQEQIHQIFGPALQKFDGDSSMVAGVQPYLEDCLKARFRGKEKKEASSPLLTPSQKRLGAVVAGCLIFGIGLWTFLGRQANYRWQQYLTTLEEQPGIVVVSQRKHGGRFFLAGLRDPAAADPATLLQATQLNENKVEMTWEAYLSLEAEMVRDRITTLLAPPDTVTLALTSERTLQLSGTASAQWIANTRQTLQRMPSLTSWDDSQLITSEQASLQAQKALIESQQLYFLPERAILTEIEKDKLYEQIQMMQQLITEANAIQQPIEIAIAGYSDASEDDSNTLWLGQLRANYIQNFLTTRGISKDLITTRRTQRPAGTSVGGTFQITFPEPSPDNSL
ncbi:MAG: hypothetical protein AAFS04_05850 [Cyanobacteria bacterium J06631_9]